MVAFPDGRRIRAAGHNDPRHDVPDPEFAVYLLHTPPTSTKWPSRWVAWPDFGLPTSAGKAVTALREAHRRATTDRVEVACGAGLGRTGTALALLAVLSGVAPADAVAWVRANYRTQAIETEEQEAWAEEIGATLATS